MKIHILKKHAHMMSSLWCILFMGFQMSAQLNVGDPGVTFDSGKYDSRYQQMKEWQTAGVRGGIPFLKDIKIVKNLTNGADSDAINKAIEDASKQSGLVAVFLKNGSYTINKKIMMKSNVSLIGESRAGVKCIITMTNSDAFNFYKVRNSGIYTITIEGSWGSPKYDWNYSLDANDELPNNDNISVKFKDSEDCWLDKVTIINSAKDPVRVPANHITLRDLRVDGAHKKAGGAQGYFFIQGAYNLITGCEITHIRHISLQGSNVEYNVVYDNDFKQEVSFHSGDKGNNLIENNRITLPFDMPNSKADTPNSVYNNSNEPNYFAIMGPWSTQHQNSKNPNFIYRNNCLEENHNNAKPWSNVNLLYKGPKEVKPANPATNFPALAASLTPKGGTLYPIVLGEDTGEEEIDNGTNCTEKLELISTNDAYLQASTRYNSNELRVENGKRVSYLQFKIPSTVAPIVEAKLSLTVSTDSGSGRIAIIKGNSNSWTEENLSATNKPSETILLGSLNSTFALGQSYQWILSDITAGETVTILVRQVNGNDVSFWSKEGKNTPKLSLTLDCSATRVAAVQSVLVEEKKLNTKIYPNPAQNYLVVSDLMKEDTLIVYDFSGTMILKKIAQNTEEYLDVSKLKKGSYILSISGKTSFQFIKE
ncbi:T9SS type A sorting domain-containing protein [Cellulophaga sp. Z1A5H]|uniref:CBM96 family carbohydrate-binding protein n=1 Tax=Cellulophaga sp. Z1A5H TaxID=2687291 RepID=UPI0013FDAD9C|nr:T9SS type A sorting domain-containing protein [Cellulophaga sp. Z1A5H]